MSDLNDLDELLKSTRSRPKREKRTYGKDRQPYVKIKHKRAEKAKFTDSNNPREPHNQPGLFKFTLHVIYANLYILGITFLRRKLRFERKLKKSLRELRESALNRLERIEKAVKWFFIRFRDRVRAPFLRIKRTYKDVLPEIKAKRAKGKIPFAAYLAILDTVWRLIFKIISTIFNYTAPVAAAVFLIITVRQQITQPMVLAVDYDGQTIGYIQNESEFTAATQIVSSRLTTTGASAFQISTPHFELMTLSEFNRRRSEGVIPADAAKLEKNELVNTLIKASATDVSEAYGLYVNNRFLGAVTNKDGILNEFKAIKKNSRTGKPDEEINFTKSIRLKFGLYPQNSIVDDESVISALYEKEDTDEIYIVKEGDSPSLIADKTGVPLSVLRTLNLDLEEKMFAGNEVFTQIARPFMSVSSSYTDIVEEPVAFDTVENQNATYVKGYRNVYQEGEDGLRRVKYRVTSENGFEKSREEISFEMLKYPVAERVTVGISDPVAQVIIPPSGSSGQGKPSAPQGQPKTNSGFIRPVPYGVGYVSAGINGYAGHTGVDIAVMGGTGTPILASASGTVVLAKNTGVGYGRYIMIDHGNGYTTLYAHNSALYVTVGQYVQQGEVIAAMGRTGNASGVHCHFEVRYYGQIHNPANYIGYY